MIHNEITNYNHSVNEEISYIKNLVLIGLEKYSVEELKFPKRENMVNYVEKERKKKQKVIIDEPMSITYKSNDEKHYFILYRMDDGNIADIYMRLNEDKNIDVFEYNILKS